jgi:WD40 repeat protein
MISFYIGSQIGWEKYLKTTSLAKDLKGQIRRGNKKQQIVISEQTREIVASREALAKRFSSGFDSLNVTLEWGFGRLESAVNSVGASIDALRASFDYNMALMIEQMQLQNQSMLNFLKQMEAVHATLENPTLTQAREFFRIGCDRLAKGLLDKALEAFLESAQKDDANFMTQLMIGKLYLYGVNEDCNVLDLQKAEQHLRAAARYAKAETERLPEAKRFAGEALLHASISCYAQANEQVISGNAAAANEYLQTSYDLASQATEVYPQLSESHYHRAKFAALLGDGKTAMASLQHAIALDEAYCLKADSDFDFRFVLSDVNQLFRGLRNNAGDEVRRQLQQSEKLLNDWVYVTVEAQNVETDIRQILNLVKENLARNTYFDSREALDLLQKAEQIFKSLLVHKDALHTVPAHLGRISSIAYSPDQATFATGGSDRMVRLWRLPENEITFVLKGHFDIITELAFSYDGATLASVDGKGGVKLWNVADGGLRCDLVKPESPIHCVAFSPDDTKLVTGGYDRDANLWDLSDGSLLYTLSGHKSSVDTAVFSPDGRYLATGSPDNTAMLWDVHTGKLRHSFLGCSGLANCLAFCSNGQMLISGSSDSSVRFYRVEDGKLLHILPERSGSVTWMALSPDSNILATVNYGKAIQLWDIANGKLLHNLTPFSPGITAVRFSPDGSVLAGNDFQNQSVKLWNVQDGKLMHIIAGNITCIAFTPDSAVLTTGDENGNLKFWGRMVVTRGSFEANQKLKAKPVVSKLQERKMASGSRPSPIGESSPHAESGRGASGLNDAAPRPRTASPKPQPPRPAPAQHEQPQQTRRVEIETPAAKRQKQTYPTEAELQRLLREQELEIAKRAQSGRCLECGRKLGFFAKLWGLKFCREHGF